MGEPSPNKILNYYRHCGFCWTLRKNWSWYPACAMAKSVEHQCRMLEIGSLLPGRVNPVTYSIYNCRVLAWHSALVWLGKDWLVQSQDNITGWDIWSWRCWHDFPVGSTVKSPWVHPVTSRYPSWYDLLRCSKDLNLHQLNQVQHTSPQLHCTEVGDGTMDYSYSFTMYPLIETKVIPLF